MDAISSLCNCIKVLCDSQHGVCLAPSTTKIDAVIAHLKNNISLMLSELKAQPELQKLLSIYERFIVLDNDDNVHWNFVTWCLILLSELHDKLSCKTVNAMEKKGAPLLSISQQKGVENCLQFIIALGILPNLIPGVGIALKNRTVYASVVKPVRTGACPRTKYKRLVSSLAVLLRCTSDMVLQSIIITRHAGDLLAALFQLCYTPIKKLKNNEEYDTSKMSYTSKKDKLSQLCHCQATSSSCKKGLCHLHKKLIDMLEEITDDSQWTEDQLIHEMWADRHNFMPRLKVLLQKICPDVLIWQLFLLQGMHGRSDEKSQSKTPLWLRKLCNQMLTEQLLKPHGVKLFICIMLDKMTDFDMKEGSVDKAKVDAVARLISNNPVQNMTFAEYIEGISGQVIDLLHSKEEKMKCIYASVASSVVIQLAEIDYHVTEKHVFRKLLKELWICLDNAEISRYEEGVYLVKEDALSFCTEILHKIFVCHGVPSQQNIFQLLLPFYHLLFTIFAQVQSGVSFLRPQLKALLVSVLKSSSVADSLILLRLASFEDVAFQPVQLVTGVKCVLGDSGGLVLIKNSSLSPEDLLDDINAKCSAIATILDEISDRKLKVSYFLCLLKRLGDLSVETAVLDGSFQTRDLRNNLTLLQQLQEIAQTVGEDLVEDITEAVNFVKVILEKAVVAQRSEKHCQQLLFGSETVLMSLVILSTITQYKNQLSASHWMVMKECLPSLQQFVTNCDDDFLKNMCENLIFAIATHGAVANGNKASELSSVQKNSMSPFKPERVLNSKKSTSFGMLDPVSEETRHEVVKEHDLYEHPAGALNCTTGDSVMKTTKKQNFPTDHLNQMGMEDTCSSQEGESSTFKQSGASVCDLPSGNKSYSETSYSTSFYEGALKDLNDPVLPVRGHGLITLTRLLNEKNAEALAHKEDLLKIFMENLSDEDSYIYLVSIQGLSALADVSIELVLPAVLKKFSDTDDERTEVQLKLGEVLLKICKNLGEMTVNYRSELVHAYLCGAKHKKPEVRASSLSNLGEVCKWLKFSLGPFLQEILLCVLSLLKTDADMEVRRSAVLVIRLLLQGTGKDTFVVLESEMKELYHVLRHVRSYEKDDVLKLHAQLALEEINGIVKDIFSNRSVFTKEIRVLDPF